MEMTYQSIHPDVTKNRLIGGEIEKKDVYKTVGKLLCEEFTFDFGKVKVTVTTPDGFIKYEITKRDGDYYICSMKDTLPLDYVDLDAIKPTMLTHVDASEGDNHYNFFKMRAVTGKEAEKVWDRLRYEKRLSWDCERGDALLACSHGRLGESEGSTWEERTYYESIKDFWHEYFKKLKEGFVDSSVSYYSNKAKEETAKKVERKPIVEKKGPSLDLFKELRGFSKQIIKESKMTVPITEGIISDSKDYIAQMRDIAKDKGSVKEFNDIVLQLLRILQRPISTATGNGVKDMLAKNADNFNYIIHREEDLLFSMEGVFDGDVAIQSGDFSDYGIEVYLANDKQKAEVLRKLNDDLAKRVKTIYRVIPTKQKARFNDYLQREGDPKVRMFWHGSRNENWMSIIQNSLQLNPDAVITGKMFGKGIYFAPSSAKSWNYTSINGSYWANGKSDTAFMGLYACAYGKPYDVYSFDQKYTRFDAKELKNACADANCLHAHKGNGMLLNDEIVFYDEAAILLNYIVEFR